MKVHILGISGTFMSGIAILAKKKGYKIASNVSKNLDILVFGEKSGSKLKKAKDLKINILNEKEFLNLIN